VGKILGAPSTILNDVDARVYAMTVTSAAEMI
jgi:hypothetical protein